MPKKEIKRIVFADIIFYESSKTKIE